GKTYSNRECRNPLERHIQIHAKYVQDAVTYPIAPQTRGALISFSYNVGGSAMRKSTAVRLINQGKIEQGCKALGMWNKARVNGKLKVVKGLVNRRNEEIKLCLSGLQR
ncbi:glycoside hydrolase family protein, partial [Enterococcus faecium]|uniref:glycoside hydrolase family protein n=1 Tax=Enterococcus faecium TaxID=1352 RepID=UPI0015E6366B